MTDPTNNPHWTLPYRPSLSLVWHPNSCGWHVFLLQTDGTAESRLRPHMLRKICLPYRLCPKYGPASELLMHVASLIAHPDLNEVPWPH